MNDALRLLRGAIVGGIALASGCGGGTGWSTFGSGQQFSISSALTQIPLDHAVDEDGNIQIFVADLLAAGEATGQRRPTGSTAADEAIEWLGPMSGVGEAPVFVPLPTTFRDSVRDLGEYEDEVGFAITDVDAVIESFAPPTSMTVLAGDLRPAADTEVTAGVGTIGEDEDFEVDPANGTVARPLGSPLRVATGDGLVLLSSSTDAAAAWIDTESARMDSDESFASAAEILDDRAVVSAALFRSDFSATDFDEEEVSGPITTPFDTVAVGWSVIDDDAAIIVIYVTADDTAAGVAASEIEEAFSSGRSLVTGEAIDELVIVADVRTAGSAVVVSLGLPPNRPNPSIVLNMVFAKDRPFTYGP